ncbi:MAG: hypothetical protein A3K19_25830 [Lentisphaerae bacterium RIFOXYB12_FULL_65_16]|nr:MAG: hypothetical protein A3K18_31830 [Lentisphaerae bacterium RIFOXYA12_64_32]OGV91392.1 MAG: hypothetical protein A3K19_25830 [Lentisphaerae bacterium RIFOXYB12_FULL_65_16]
MSDPTRTACDAELRLRRADADGLKQALARLNGKWEARLGLFRGNVPPPWWAEGLAVQPETRRQYELYLPVAEFCRDLRALAELFFACPSWIPSVLRRVGPGATCGEGRCTPLSLPDIWDEMPPALAGRVSFADMELLPLFCALAAPARFGTAPGRYPEQQTFLQEWFVNVSRNGLRVLDLGCGVGHGTYEVLALAEACGVRNPLAVGVTCEPLEAWMAAHRLLPHDPLRTSQFERFAPAVPVRFAAGDAVRLPVRGTWHLVVCNGLVGGEYLCGPETYEVLLSELERALAPGGLATFANPFHEGRSAHVAAFAALARTRGWTVQGDVRLLWLSLS